MRNTKQKRVKEETHLTSVRLRKLRRGKNLSQKEVAENLGFSRDSSYQKYETGVVIPPPDKLAKLADLFGVTTDYLLGREAEPPDMAALQKSQPLMLRTMCQMEFAEALKAAGDDVTKLKALWDLMQAARKIKT